MKRKLRIAIFHFGFFYSGGGEKLVLEEIKGLKKLGHEVECFSSVIDERKCFPDIIKEFNIKPILPQLPFWFPDREMVSILLSCALFPLLVWRFRKFDIIFGANQPSPYFGWIINKLLGKPYVIYLAQPTRHLYPRRVDQETGLRVRDGWVFCHHLVRIAKKFISWADRKSILGASAMLTNGAYIGNLIEKVYQRHRVDCPAGCYPLPEKQLDFNYRWKKPYILLTNRHFPQKRFEYIISSLPMVLKKVPEAKLVITGEKTDYTSFLENLISQLGLGESVVFTGLVDEKDLKKLYRESACYVYPAPEEDFGMGVIEAMACGVPVVAWNRGGPTVTVVDGITGFLAKPYKIADFGMKMRRLLVDRERNEKMGRAGWERVQKGFSYDRHNQILEKALLEALGGKSEN